MKKYYWILALMVTAFCWMGCSSGKRAKEAARSASRSGEPGVGSVAGGASSGVEFSLPTIESRFLDKDAGSARVYLFVTVYKGKTPVTVEEFRSKFTLNYVVYTDYGSRERIGYGNVPLNEETVTKTDGYILVQFDVKKPGNKESGVVLSEISEAGTMKKSLNDLPIRFSNLRTTDRYGLFKTGDNQFIKRHYVNVGEEILIKDLQQQDRQMYMYYYAHTFDPAGSPMNTSPRAGSARALKVDSLFQVSLNRPYTFTKEGLYYMVTDTASTEGLGFLVANDRFPKLTLPDLLRGPVQYMSTNQEIRDLLQAGDPKKALDKYWLSLMNGNQDLARAVIRNYYSRVEEANRLFTTYKEGWKTDKGMIFIILGNPDKVQRSKDREVWVYNQRANANNINFTFNRRNNQFVDDHYELVRYVEYQPIWYPIVEAWRTGAIR